jgi:transcriptional regulator with XRE-family HTH domain
MYDESCISKRIKARRRECGLTQGELAKKMIGVEIPIESLRNSISVWEGGKIAPSTSSLISLCNALDCDIDYLLGAIDTPRKAVHDLKNETGLSEKAVQNLIGKSKAGGDKGIEILSEFLENKNFWDAIAYINYAKYAETGRSVEMSDDLKEAVETVQQLEEAVLTVQQLNNIERNPNAVILNGEQMRDLNVYHASTKLSICIDHIIYRESNKSET